MKIRASLFSPRNQVAFLLLLAFAIAVGGNFASPFAQNSTIFAFFLAISAVLRSLLLLSTRIWDIHKSLNNIPRQLGLKLVSELHSMQAILNRFPECNIPTTSWSLRFTNLHAILNILDKRQPTTVVEFGSGISTILIAAWMRERGSGHLVSFDHDEVWAQKTMENLSRNGLSACVTVVFAPLERTVAFGQVSPWYRVGNTLDNLSDVGLVVVDGPPGKSASGALSRLPALERVHHALAPDCWVLLDDTIRDDEQEIVRIWSNTFPEFTVQMLDGFSGASLFHRNEIPTPAAKQFQRRAKVSQ